MRKLIESAPSRPTASAITLGAGQHWRIRVNRSSAPRSVSPSGFGGRSVVPGLEGGEELGQELRQSALLGGRESGQHVPLVGEVGGGELVDEPLPVGGELDEQPAPVGRVENPGDEPGALEMAQAIRHRSGGAHEAEVEGCRRQAVRGTDAPQRREDIPAFSAQAMLGKQPFEALIEVPGQATDACDHRQRRRIQIGTLSGPLCAHALDMIPNR